MTELLTAAQMREIEGSEMASGRVSGLDLMERAGAGVVEAIEGEWPDLSPGRAVVLCGPGNNGGDGFVIARLLEAKGWTVEVFLYGDVQRLPPDAAENCRRWQQRGAIGGIEEVLERHGPSAEHPQCFRNEPVLFIDALFGTGLARPVENRLAGFLRAARDHDLSRSVAVDFPSGHCSDSGRALGAHGPLNGARAFDMTVTFHRPKTGHVTLDGARASGALRLVDIGLGKAQRAFNQSGARVARWFTAPFGSGPGRAFLAGQWSKSVDAHKYEHGSALVLSGPPGQGGAARLAARGALRVGAGLVTVGCPMRAVAEHAGHLTAIMVRGLDGTAGLAELLEDSRYNALCLGPGLGLGPATGELVRVALAAQRGTVLDADALSRFQRDPDALFALLHDRVVLTPHGGEFARLFPDIASRLKQAADSGPAYSKLDAARDSSARAGCVVLLKGPDTVVADPKGQVTCIPALYDRAAPWLATAGAGDVLAGLVTGLLARGKTAMEAAAQGAFLHIEAARSFGPGLIAEDIPEALPRVFRDLGV